VIKRYYRRIHVIIFPAALRGSLIGHSKDIHSSPQFISVIIELDLEGGWDVNG
jgi:hypothetical protein